MRISDNILTIYQLFKIASISILTFLINNYFEWKKSLYLKYVFCYYKSVKKNVGEFKVLMLIILPMIDHRMQSIIDQKSLS